MDNITVQTEEGQEPKVVESTGKTIIYTLSDLESELAQRNRQLDQLTLERDDLVAKMTEIKKNSDVKAYLAAQAIADPV
jgi:cell division protein FtsB